MQHEIQQARRNGVIALKLIHGYGSSGTGGSLRTELQKDLHMSVQQGSLRAAIAGEHWRIADETTWDLLKKYPEWKKDPDLGRNNRGICIVVL
jgi:hypothetical protein